MKASSSSYRKQMRLVNNDKERAASRLTSNKSYNADFEHSIALSRRTSKELFEKDSEHARPCLHVAQ